MKSSKLFAAALALAALIGLQAPGQSVAAEEIELKMQFASPDGTPWNDMDRRFAKQIEAITGGRAKVEFFPPNSVTPFKDWLQSTGAGLLDLGFVWHPILPGKFVQLELFSLPGLAKNQTIDSVVYWRLEEEFPEMGDLFTAEDNVVELATFVAMGSHLHTGEPVRQLSDIKGKVFAAQDSAGVKVLEKLGASASVMVGPDAYLALQRGAIDGVLCAWGWVNNFKLNEVTTYHTLMNLNPGTYSSVMNKDTWEKLTPEEQQLKFGFLLEALKYGPPPHGGIALGLDRIAMLLAGLDNIRDTIAFPKTARAVCPLTEAPAPVSPEQLRELGLRLAKTPS